MTAPPAGRCGSSLALLPHLWLDCTEPGRHLTCGAWHTTHDNAGRETTVRITWLAGHPVTEGDEKR